MIIPANTSDILTEQELFGEFVKSVAVILAGRSCVLHMQVRHGLNLIFGEAILYTGEKSCGERLLEMIKVQT